MAYSRYYLVLLFLSGWQVLSGQLPSTDLYLFQLEVDDSSRWHIHSPQYLSSFNEGGYTNQPSFFDDDLVYVSAGDKGADQTDIFALNVNDRTVRRVTLTPEGEYSPTRIPGENAFSCVRQVVGDEVDQQIYRYPLDQSRDGKSITPNIRNVGYYTWITGEDLAVDLVTQPPRLAWITLEDDRQKILASKIGRCLRRTAIGNLAYVHKYSQGFWYLKTLAGKSAESQIIAQMPGETEDFEVTPNGEFITGSGSILYVLDPSKDDKWRPIADLSIFGLENITRLALNSRMQLAIVDSEIPPASKDE